MINNILDIIAESDIGYLLLLIATIGDLVIPFLLAPFHKQYNSLTMVMSLLGNRKSPVYFIYNFWLIIAGVLLIFGSVKLYLLYLPISDILSRILLLCIMFYAVGACILSGIFSVGETRELTTLPEKIHGLGSVLGFILLAFTPLIIGILSFQSGDSITGIFSIIFFILAITFFVLFVMADKEKFAHTIISYEGLWQRLALTFMYAPIILVSYNLWQL